MSATRPRIGVVGSANLDLTFRTSRFPRPGETLAAHSFQLGFGGKGANQAVTAARLGAQVAMVARVGGDVFGEQTLRHFRDQGIDTTHVHVDPDRATGVAGIVVDESAQNCILLAAGGNAGLSADDVRAAEGVIRRADVLLCQLEVPVETTWQALRLARAAGVRTILNPAPAVELPDDLLQLVDLCVPNETEAEMLTGRSLARLDEVIQAARRLRQRGPRTVLVTLGDRGVLLDDGQTTEHVAAVPVSAVDATGAGDAFVGSLAVFLAEGRPLPEAVRGANAVAALSVTRPGTQTSFPTRGEADAFLQRLPAPGWRLATAIVLALAGLITAAAARADEPELVAHWKLAGDVRDSSGNGLDAVNHGVTFGTGPLRAATFKGRDRYLQVNAAPALQLGTSDFTLALWVHTDEVLADDLGDLVSQFEPVKRIGFHLALRTNTGVTSSQANTRQLQFGIDAGSVPQWTDEGRPGNAVLAFGMAVYDGKLYVGTAAAGKSESGRVYQYNGPQQWVDCGAPDRCNAVSALAVYQGKLYAATSRYRFAGSALPESPNLHLGGKIYRYEGKSRWAEVGRLPNTEAVGGLAVYRGRLYASSLYRPAGFFRYEEDGRWTALPVPEGKRVEALAVFNGHLWASSYDGGRVYRYDGTAWEDLGQLGDNTQTYSFAVHHGRLWAGTWPSGKVYQWQPGGSWLDRGRLGGELEVMGMLVHNGKLYAGTLPLAEVYRYDGGNLWTSIGRLDRTPDVKYRRAWAMAAYQGRLFCSTLPSGHVHSLETGPCVTFDRELAPGWRHVAAVKQGGHLRLFVDGKPVAESSRFNPAHYYLGTGEPLTIGGGAGDFFHGKLRDVRLYRRALTPSEIEQVMAARSAGER